MATRTQTRRRPEDFEAVSEELTGRYREAGREAQEAWSRSTQLGVETFSAWAEVSQRLLTESYRASIQGTKEAARLWTELFHAAFDGVEGGLVSVASNQPALRSWQRVLDGSARAFTRYAEVVQGTAQEGAERIREAVDTLSEQAKENAEGAAKMAQSLAAGGSEGTGNGGRARK